MEEGVKIEPDAKAEPVRRGRKPASDAVQSTIAIEIVCKPSERAEAAETKFMELADPQGGVMAVNSACGGSVYYKDLEEFPKSNCRCTCGQAGHFMVKFVTA